MNLQKTILNFYIITITLFLSAILFSCNKDEQKGLDTSSYFITAKVTHNGEIVDYESTSGVMVIKAVASGFELESFNNEGSGEYRILMSFSRQTELDGEPLPENNISFGITKEENGEELTWITSVLFAGNNGNADGNFTITNETDSYMEGTFNFNGTLVSEDGFSNDIIEVTNGQFKAQKLNRFSGLIPRRSASK